MSCPVSAACHSSVAVFQMVKADTVALRHHVFKATSTKPSTNLMPKSHERILRRIIRRFGIFPTMTYLKRISNDANVRITYEEHSGRVLNF